MTLHYTNSGRLEVILKTPVFKRTNEKNISLQEFADGIYCEFYGDCMKLKARLTARYAVRDGNDVASKRLKSPLTRFSKKIF